MSKSVQIQMLSIDQKINRSKSVQTNCEIFINNKSNRTQQNYPEVLYNPNTITKVICEISLLFDFWKT